MDAFIQGVTIHPPHVKQYANVDFPSRLAREADRAVVRLTGARTWNDLLECADKLEALAADLRQLVKTWRPET